jgi:hypothetical protein
MIAPRLLPRHRRRRWFLAVGGLLFAGLALAAASALTLSGDAAWLRGALKAREEASWSTKVQGSAGPVLLGLARAIVARIDAVDPEVRTLLASVRRASVGVYQVGPADADALVAWRFPEGARGWTRLVAVRSPDEVVLIYAKEPSASAKAVDVAVAVRAREQVVIVSARVAPEGLVPLLAEFRPRPQLARVE